MLAFTSQVLPVGAMAAEVVVWLPELVAAMVGLDSGLHVVWPLPVCVLSPQGHWGCDQGWVLAFEQWVAEPLQPAWPGVMVVGEGPRLVPVQRGRNVTMHSREWGPRVTEVLVPSG